MPSINADEAVKVGDMTVLAAENLETVCRHLDVVSGISQNQEHLLSPVTLPSQPQVMQYAYDLADVKGSIMHAEHLRLQRLAVIRYYLQDLQGRGRL